MLPVERQVVAHYSMFKAEVRLSMNDNGTVLAMMVEAGEMRRLKRWQCKLLESRASSCSKRIQQPYSEFHASPTPPSISEHGFTPKRIVEAS